MKVEKRFLIDDDLYAQFELSTKISKENLDDAINTSIRWYISNVIDSMAKTYTPHIAKKSHIQNSDVFAKAISRIPKWAKKPNQYNHRIIKAYLMAEDYEDGNVTKDLMRKLCSNSMNNELFVPKFDSNYAQMKIDNQSSHGKVFEDDGTNVWLWPEVENVIRKYQDYFYKK